ncbi:CRAL-TRIO domain-containing protein [Gorgonomyces haynaldii]|nr:CRAL-TRIO domain-containing protein [Gorgonomyces haynaldii]
MSLSQLLEDNKEQIATLKAKVSDCLGDHDDIWLLRFVLSNSGLEEQEEAIRYYVKFFDEHKDAIAEVRKNGKLEKWDQITKFQVTGNHKYTSEGEPVFYIRLGLCNTKALMDAHSYDDVVLWMILNRLNNMDYCDRETRKRNKIVKCISVLDFQGFSLTRGNDSRFSKIIGDTSKISEKIFPQLLGKSVFVNVPSYFMFVLNLIKPLMSKKTVEKMTFCPGQLSGKPISACPYLRMYLKLEDVPSFLGGQCNCPGGCVGGAPNSLKTPIAEIDQDGLISINVSARKSEQIQIPFAQGMTAEYHVKVESKSIDFSLSFVQSDGQSIQIIPKKTIHSTDTIKSTFKIPQDGMLSLDFDNTSSILRSKKVFYKAEAA